MVAPEALLDVVLGEVGVGELHLPVGKQVSVSHGAVNLVGVEAHHVRSTGFSNQSLKTIKWVNYLLVLTPNLT